MSTNTLNLNDQLYQYYQSVAFREADVLKDLRLETQNLEFFNMQIAPEQGAFMAMLVQLSGAQRIVEVGTFTGYSSLSMAMALPDEGELYALDISEEWTNIARKYWQKAGVDDKIELMIAPAVKSLQALLQQGLNNQIDLMFIDADKPSYQAYFELGLQLVRKGGVILFDNVLWGGDVADDTVNDENTSALRELNQFLLEDSRIDLAMLPIGDGLTLARKR